MNKREQLTAMRLEDFKAHLRTIGRWIFGTSHRCTATESAACAQEANNETKTKK